jgi:predicted metal-binding protein
VGSLEEIADKLLNYQRGILMQYVKHLNVHNDKAGLKQSRNEFLMKVLRVEKYLQNNGVSQFWTLVGGHCGVCDVCSATLGLSCLHPEQARMPMEGLGIDVLALLDRVGLDNKFHDDKVTWDACILVSGMEGKRLTDI